MKLETCSLFPEEVSQNNYFLKPTVLERLGYLETWSRVKALHNLSVVKETVGPVSDGHHTAAATVYVNAVHISECQPDVRG